MILTVFTLYIKMNSTNVSLKQKNNIETTMKIATFHCPEKFRIGTNLRIITEACKWVS